MPNYRPIILVLLFAACSPGYDRPAALLPQALATAGDGVVHIGRRVPGATPGEVIEYRNLDLPDGAISAWVEIDAEGNAGSFEIWYRPEARYSDVVRHYDIALGPPTGRYARLAGDCVVWEDTAVRFEVCHSNELAEHGRIIARVWPARPVEV